MQWVLTVLCAALPLTLRPGFGHAADDAKPAPDVATEQQQASRLSGRESRRLSVRLAGDGGAVFETTAESVLKWSNPDAGRVYGDVYIWTNDGRPSVVASIYRWYSPYQSLTIEFCSLSTANVVAERQGQVIWEPVGPGIRWRELPAADPPAGSRPARLTQMRRFANRFVARLSDSRADQATVPKELRLLSHPIFRYGEGRSVDGALFAFVVGTDPELLLLVESGASGWQYALARINRDTLSVSLDNQAVQRFEYIPAAELCDVRKPYTCYDVKDFQATEIAPRTP